MIFPQSVDNDRTLIVQLLAEDASAGEVSWSYAKYMFK